MCVTRTFEVCMQSTGPRINGFACAKQPLLGVAALCHQCCSMLFLELSVNNTLRAVLDRIAKYLGEHSGSSLASYGRHTRVECKPQTSDWQSDHVLHCCVAESVTEWLTRYETPARAQHHHHAAAATAGIHPRVNMACCVQHVSFLQPSATRTAAAAAAATNATAEPFTPLLLVNA
jgi:hypothetical protein